MTWVRTIGGVWHLSTWPEGVKRGFGARVKCGTWIKTVSWVLMERPTSGICKRCAKKAK